MDNETVRYLASYIASQQERIITFSDNWRATPNIQEELLAKVIQEFYDELP